MKLNIVILEGPGGSGKSTLIGALISDNRLSHEISFPFCSSPFEADREKIKLDIAEKTKTEPFSVALRMLEEQMWQLSLKAEDIIKCHPNEDEATIYVDRAWVSTYVYQLAGLNLGGSRYSFESWSQVVGIKLAALVEDLKELGFEQIRFNVICLMPSFETLMGRKISRIAFSAPDKLKVAGFVEKLQIDSRKIWESFDDLELGSTKAAGVWIGYLSYNPERTTPEEAAQTIRGYAGVGL